MTRLKISAVAALAIALLGTGAGVLVAHAPADQPMSGLRARPRSLSLRFSFQRGDLV
jgi:hypothetical protein